MIDCEFYSYLAEGPLGADVGATLYQHLMFRVCAKMNLCIAATTTELVGCYRELTLLTLGTATDENFQSQLASYHALELATLHERGLEIVNVFIGEPGDTFGTMDATNDCSKDFNELGTCVMMAPFHAFLLSSGDPMPVTLAVNRKLTVVRRWTGGLPANFIADLEALLP
jgi:hypothetical protein